MAWHGNLVATLCFTFIAATFAYWFSVVTFLQDMFRRHCEQKFGVTIDASGKHWQISGASSASRMARLQLLRPLYILTAIGAWLFAAFLFFMTIELLSE